jgi:hypothetical protein
VRSNESAHVFASLVRGCARACVGVGARTRASVLVAVRACVVGARTREVGGTFEEIASQALDPQDLHIENATWAHSMIATCSIIQCWSTDLALERAQLTHEAPGVVPTPQELQDDHLRSAAIRL